MQLAVLEHPSARRRVLAVCRPGLPSHSSVLCAVSRVRAVGARCRLPTWAESAGAGKPVQVLIDLAQVAYVEGVIGYVTLGTNRFAEAAAFYDGLLEIMGAVRFYETERNIAWRVVDGSPIVSISRPFDGAPATVGNGSMVALAARSSGEVDRLHARALELGGRDEGAPGLRGASSFYAAYFRDLDANKLNAFIW